MRERGLITQRDELSLTGEKYTFLAKLGINRYPEDALLISLFSYENSAIAKLLDIWSQAPNPIICVVPLSKTLTSINAALNLHLHTGDDYTVCSLQLKVIPFLTQTDYDQLLWACDINFVRGEDSFVRAQWASKPFVWHIYPQEKDTHLIKLNAFLDKYTDAMEPFLAAAIKELWMAWNTEEDCDKAWSQLLKYHQHWITHNQNWCKHLCFSPDLATNLVHFCQKYL